MMRYLMLAAILIIFALFWAAQPTCKGNEIRVRGMVGTHCVTGR